MGRFNIATLGLTLSGRRSQPGCGNAVFFGALDVSETENIKTLTNIGLGGIAGVLMVMNTEDGFACGWLWASPKRAGKIDIEALILISLVFIVWHISAISLNTGFDLPARAIPIFLINRTILGMIWGVVRMDSGSVLSRQ